MRRYVTFAVCGLLFVAVTLQVFGGPWWGYVVAFLFALTVTPFVLAYPVDPASRLWFAIFGIFLIAIGILSLIFDDLNWYEVGEALSFIITGVAILIGSAWPWLTNARAKR